MKKTCVVIVLLLAIVLLTGGITASNLFITGKVKIVSNIGAQNLSVTDEKVFFTPIFATSADVMSGYSHRFDENILYVKIKSVLVGGFGKKNVKIKGDFSSLQKIMLEDKTDQKIIWEK